MKNKYLRFISCILAVAMMLSIGIVGFAVPEQEGSENLDLMEVANDEGVNSSGEATAETGIMEEDPLLIPDENLDDPPIARGPAQPNITVAVEVDNQGRILSFTYSGFTLDMVASLQTIVAADFTLAGTTSVVTTVAVVGTNLVLTVDVPFATGSGYSLTYTGGLPVWLDITDQDIDEVIKPPKIPVERNPNSYTVKNDGDPLWLGPNIFKDANSPTGYTVTFCYDDPTAQSVEFRGDMMLCRWDDPTDLTRFTRNDRADAVIYSPWEYEPGMMRRGGTVGLSGYPAVNYIAPMTKDPDTGWWIHSVPLAAGANQYWFNKVDANGASITRMLPDPANMPIWSPASNVNTKNAYNAVYVPYDAKQNYRPLLTRATYEIPRTDGQTGTLVWDDLVISGTTRYLGVYTPYGYDPNRAEPYKTIYILHGGGQDESDWVGIGSVQHIMDNLVASGEAEASLIVAMGTSALGSAANGFSGLVQGIIPYIEDNYNVSTSAMDRAFGGLSMGASTTASIINYNALLFGYYFPLSGGGGNSFAGAANVDVPYFYLCDGGYEQLLARSLGNLPNVNAHYVTNEFAGAHDFNTWNQAFTDLVRNYLWRPEAYARFPERPAVSYTVQQVGDPYHKGPNIIQDPASPTGYTVKFFYEDVTGSASVVYFNGDLSLRDGNNLSSTTNYAPEDFAPGYVRVGNSGYQKVMRQITDPNEFGPEFVGLFYHEMPLGGGANQYWFYHDSPSAGSTGLGTAKWYPDPNNMPIWNPSTVKKSEHINGIKRAYNSIYIPYDAKQDSPILEARAATENPRTDAQKGVLKWERIPHIVTSYGTSVYLAVYTPYGYDPNRAEAYKTVYMTPATDQDEADWFGIGSAQNIMDNLVAEGRAEPFVIVSVSSRAEVIGGASNGFNNLMKNIIPFIEANYNVSKKAVDRAIGGHYTTAQTLLANNFALDFGYFSMFSYTSGNNIANSPNVAVPRYYFCNGYTEGALAMANLDAANAMYAYDRPTGGHNFNAWNQGLVSYFEKLWNPVDFVRKEGPILIKDPTSPTGYTARFTYRDATADQMYFCGDINLSDHSNLADTTVYSPFDYKPGYMRRGGSQFRQPMDKGSDGLWYYEVPLAAGANQYWFNRNTNTSYMMPDPLNHPQWSPNSNWATKNAYNALYVPYDPVQDYAPLAARVVENPRTDGQTGTWSYVAIDIPGYATPRYMGVYLPYGYDENRAEPYKLIYMLHGAGQDESDWMGIGSVQNILDNLIYDGLTEPAVLVSLGSAYFGSASAADVYPNLFNVVLPFVEANYNVSSDPADRSFAGLSMGAMNSSTMIRYGKAASFGYYGLFSGAQIANVILGQDLDVPNILIGDGLYEGGQTQTNLNNLENAGAKYDYIRVAGAHDFNTWSQLFTIYARDFLWKPDALKNRVSLTIEPNTILIGASRDIDFSVSATYLNGGANVITGTLSIADSRFDVSLSTSYPGATAIYNAANGNFSLFTTGTFADSPAADLMTITLTLKSGESLSNGDTVSAILDSISFLYTVNNIPSKIVKGTATTTVWLHSGVDGDLSGDGIVDSMDLSIALTLYGKRSNGADWYSSGAYIADIDGNGIVEMDDILYIAYLSIQ